MTAIVDGFALKNGNGWIFVRHDKRFLLVNLTWKQIFLMKLMWIRMASPNKSMLIFWVCIQDRHSIEDMLIFWFVLRAVNNWLYDQDRRVPWKTLSFALYCKPWLTGCLFRTDKSVENVTILCARVTGCMFRTGKSVENMLIFWFVLRAVINWLYNQDGQVRWRHVNLLVCFESSE